MRFAASRFPHAAVLCCNTSRTGRNDYAHRPGESVGIISRSGRRFREECHLLHLSLAASRLRIDYASYTSVQSAVGSASPEPFPADPCDSHVRPTGARKTIRSMRLSRTMQHPSIATHRRRPLYVGALCSAAKAVSREGPCPFGHCCADRSSCERNDASEIILPAATKLRHAIRRECKLLTRRCELRSSLQSIMGATDIFLLRVNRLHSIHESILGDYSDIPEI
jgi:hypothetical protein